MKTFMKTARLLAVLAVMMTLIPLASRADDEEYLDEPQYFGAPPLPGDQGGDAGVPIDGGIGILVAAGIAYGVRKRLSTKNAGD